MAHPSVFRWMKVVDGRMKFGRVRVWSVKLKCNSEELGPILGYWKVVMGLCVEFLSVFVEMTGF